jgi:hypothetical protein
MSTPSTAETVNWLLPIAGALILLLQCAMVAVVLGGFSLPHALGYAESSTESSTSSSAQFTAVHAISMWGVIPPVIASMFASYSMFGFVSLLHVLDIQKLHTSVASACQITTRIYGHKKRKNDDSTSHSGSEVLTATEMAASSMSDDTSLESLADVQEFLHKECAQSHPLHPPLPALGCYCVVAALLLPPYRRSTLLRPARLSAHDPHACPHADAHTLMPTR